MRIGYACSWWRPLETTWSGTSAALMDGLAARPDVDLVRVDAHHDRVSSAALAAIGRARGYGNWKFSGPYRRMTEGKVRRRVDGLGLDAVIGVADVEAVTDVPTFLFQDANFSVLQGNRDVLLAHAPAHVRFPGGRLAELVAEQRGAYARAAGVLSFSKWFADWLVDHDGVPRERVHVIGGGLHGLPARRDLGAHGPGGTKVLFIGRDFFRKGGDVVVKAIEQARSSGSGDFHLTVVGPTTWPMSTEVPDWVDFRGEVAAHDVRQMWSDHDLFAMPTWYEPFGLVFLEARAAGVPALGRNAYCMPELVPDSAGRLIPAAGGVEAVAEHLVAMSGNADLFESVASDADAVRAEHTWSNVAARAVASIRAESDR